MNYKIIFFILFTPSILFANDYSQMYSLSELQKLKSKYSEVILDNYHKIIKPCIPKENNNWKKTNNIKFLFPLFLEDAPYPNVFLAVVKEKTIILPVLSIKFLSDVSYLIAWFICNGKNLSPVYDYLSVLRYQDFKAHLIPNPLQAFNLSKEIVIQNEEVSNMGSLSLSTAMMFLINHEIGHIYYQHPIYQEVSAYQAQTNESQADLFSLNIMRCIGEFPSGVIPFFVWVSMFSPNRTDFKSDYEWKEYQKQTSTHPLSGNRLANIKEYMNKYAYDFARYQPNKKLFAQTLQTQTTQLDFVIQKLNNPEMQRFIRIKALSIDKSQYLTNKKYSSDSTQPFNGIYIGYSRQINSANERGLIMNLKRKDNIVDGSYSMGTLPFVFQGSIKNKTLTFQWSSQSSNNSGYGELKLKDSIGNLEGYWGYGYSKDNGGIIFLSKQK